LRAVRRNENTKYSKNFSKTQGRPEDTSSLVELFEQNLKFRTDRVML
jgi:hypothetical protein